MSLPVQVIDLVQKYGVKDWSIIAKHLRTRTGKQCRERWHNHLDPTVKKSSWTLCEDYVICQVHRRLGNRWAYMSKLLPGRSICPSVHLCVCLSVCLFANVSMFQSLLMASINAASINVSMLQC